MNFRYPIFLDLSGKRCLVIGEGDEIAAKKEALSAFGAEVVTVGAHEFQPAHLDGCFLVISNLEDNSTVFRLCEERGILCNAADDPEHCRFSFGSVHRSGDLTIAISTNGWAPALAVRLKQKFQNEIGPEYGAFLRLLEEVRPEITTRIADFAVRKALWYRIVDSDLLELVRQAREDEARRRMRGMIEEAVNSTSGSDSRV